MQNLDKNDRRLIEALFKSLENSGTYSRQVAESCGGGRPTETDQTATDALLMEMTLENPQQPDISVLNEATTPEMRENSGETVSEETTEQNSITLVNSFDQQYILSILKTDSSASCSKADDTNVSDVDVKGPLFSDMDMEFDQDLLNLPETVKALLEQDMLNDASADTESCNVEHTVPSAQPPGVGDSVNAHVKWRLRDNLQQKHGDQPLPPADFTPKPKQEMSLEERAKVELRKQKNRDSAARSRKNQKKRERYLKKRVRYLEEEQEKLLETIEIQKERKLKTAELLNEHACKKDVQNTLNKKKLAKALEAFLRGYSKEV